MGTPAEILIKVLIEKCNNDDIKKGLDTALNIVQEEACFYFAQNQTYYN